MAAPLARRSLPAGAARALRRPAGRRSARAAPAGRDRLAKGAAMRCSSQYQPQGLAAAYEGFLRRSPSYAATTAVDDLRATDYARLDRLGHTYLDYTGGGQP